MRIVLTTALAAVLLLCSQAVCLGQSNQSKPSMLSVLVSKVKPDMTQEFEAIQKNELLPALKTGGQPWRSMTSSGAFGGLSVYVSVGPIESFAQYDGQSPLVKALGQERTTELITKLSRCVTESQRFAVRFRPDLSFDKGMKEPPPMSLITFVGVAPGRKPDWERLIKADILPAMKKAELDAYLVHEPLFGGDANEWVTVTSLKKYAELDGGPPLVKVLGQAGFDKLAAKGTGIVTSVRRSVARHRPELSYAPAASAKQ